MTTPKNKVNKANPLVPIQLDKPRHLKLSLNAMIKFQEETGKSLKDGTLEDVTLEDLRALLWACLLHEDKTLTLDEVGEMVDMTTIFLIEASLNAAMEAADTEVSDSDPLPSAEKPPRK